MFFWFVCLFFWFLLLIQVFLLVVYYYCYYYYFILFYFPRTVVDHFYNHPHENDCQVGQEIYLYLTFPKETKLHSVLPL